MRVSYEQWISAVDAILLSRSGLSTDDLPDWRYRDAYEDGLSAKAAARAAFAAAADEMES